MEDWRQIPIEDFKDLYQVSDQGRVKSMDRYVIQNNLGGPYKHFYKGKIRKPRLNKKTGYLEVNLRANNKTKWFLIHRLVAMAFIPNPDNLPEVDHISTIRTDNRVCNLRWTDRKGNALDNPITKQRQKECGSKVGKIYGKIWGPINSPYNKKRGLI